MLLKKDSYTNITNTQNLTLSIQVSLDGFCFIIHDETQKKVVHLESFSIKSEVKNAEHLVVELEHIFQQNKNLQLNFTKVSVIHKNDLFSIVPNTYFDENYLQQYVNYTIKTLTTDFFAYDSLDVLDAKTVYIPYVNVNNFIFQHFGVFEYEHYQTALLKKIIHQNNSTEPIIYVDVDEQNFQLIAVDGKKLILTNSFEYATKEDVLYYILFSFEQLKLETAHHHLVFIGLEKEQKSLLDFIKLYIKHTSIFAPINENLPKHLPNSYSYFAILNA